MVSNLSFVVIHTGGIVFMVIHNRQSGPYISGWSDFSYLEYHYNIALMNGTPNKICCAGKCIISFMHAPKGEKRRYTGSCPYSKSTL